MTKILDSSKLKVYADDKLNVFQTVILVLGSVENTVKEKEWRVCSYLQTLRQTALAELIVLYGVPFTI